MQRSSVFSPFLQQAIRDYESSDTVQLPSLEVAFAVEFLYGGRRFRRGYKQDDSVPVITADTNPNADLSSPTPTKPPSGKRRRLSSRLTLSDDPREPEDASRGLSA